ncbi:MAG TPA: hypothetical protein VFP54_08455 [Acidimicrobiales bacterium]|nr:hypothetical protein [Acidimicrobiales bacterium]
MTALAVAALAAVGTFLLVTATGPGQPLDRYRGWKTSLATSTEDWLSQAGFVGVGAPAFAVGVLVASLAVGAVLLAATGGPFPAFVGLVLTAAGLVTTARTRRHVRMDEARQAWPRMIDEIRLQTGGMGRSIPQALIAVGRNGPALMRPAFVAAEREWQVTTDLARVVAVLKRHLADATTDAVCETLLVAHEVGGAGLERRLLLLAEDRVLELEGRKDAAARQAGARFARRFVVLVPVGMGLAGMSIGGGRATYSTATGQVAVALAVAAVAGCWLWAGRLLRLPEPRRVFRDDHATWAERR